MRRMHELYLGPGGLVVYLGSAGEKRRRVVSR